MADVKIGVKIISELKYFVSLVASDPSLLNAFRRSDRDFTRNRKLPFEHLVLLIAKLCKKTLSIELETFFEELGSANACTVSAFTQQRTKLRSSFFLWWNKVLWISYYHYDHTREERWKGFRIIAVDGSNISLVKTPELTGYFGGQSNQHNSFVQAKTFYYYDVLNKLILFPRIEPYRYGEVKMAYEGIEDLEEDMLAIYDRNFCSYKMFALHLWAEKEKKFIIRAKEKMKIVSEFIESRLSSAIVEITPTADAVKGLKESGFIITPQNKLKIRLVRVDLGKTTEVLATNLWEEEGYLPAEFKALYFYRWGVETNISTQKNILQLECFSGLTVESVKQDFYATVFMTNLHSVLIKDAQEHVDEHSVKQKYPMKVNNNKSFGKLKVNLVALFLENDVQELLEILKTHFIRDTLPIRKNRSYERVTKNKPGKSKHRTYTNFKVAY